MITLLPNAALQVVASFSEADALKVEVGQTATVSFDALPDATATATVTAVDILPSTGESGVTTYSATLTLDDSPEGVRQGMSASVVVTTAEAADVLFAPTAAITTSGGTSTVTVRVNGVDTTVAVTTGLAGDTGTEITGGVSAGDELVVSTHRRQRRVHLPRRRYPGRALRRERTARRRAACRGRRPVMTAVIDLRGITKVYGSGESTVHALRGIDLEVERGDYVAIMGTSGSGKSTLMNIIGALDVASAGHYELDGINIDALDESALSIVRNRKIGFIFQSFNLIPRTSALANVELPLLYRGVKRRDRLARAREALAAVGLSDRMDHDPNELSGGQQQRVAVARALVAEPSLLLADEPTGNLDSRSTTDVLDLMDRVHLDGRTIVMITHEDDVAAQGRPRDHPRGRRDLRRPLEPRLAAAAGLPRC